MAQRQYEPATVFNARIADMRHLWTPSMEYMGKPAQKPNYFAMFVVQKTQAQWHTEPAFAGVVAAFGAIYNKNPQVMSWPISDGDMPNPQGKSSDFAKGHWLFSASTANPPKVEIAQPNQTLVPLQAKIGVKSGDYVLAAVTAAIKQTDQRAVKFYLNTVIFTAPGEEIVFAGSVNSAELMRSAQQQGLQITGFGGLPGAGGFQPPGQPNGAPQGNPFAPQGGPNFTPPGTGFAPTQQGAPGNGGSHAFQPAPGQFGSPSGGNATSPSSNPFAPPGNPFAGR